MSAVALGLLASRSAVAATADGTLITNLASATFTQNLLSGPAVTISYGATSYVIVATPCVMLRKAGNTTIQAAGGTVTFCITFSNCSDWASAMNVVVTDAVPTNCRFVSTPVNQVWSPDGSNVTTAWTSNGALWNSAPAVSPLWGFPTSPIETYPSVILKWTVDALGPGASGYICYTVSIL